MTTTIDEKTLPAAIAVEGQADIGGEALPNLLEALLEIAARACSAMLLSLFAFSAIMHWRADPGRVTLLLLVVAECFTVGLSLFARIPVRRDWTPFAFVCSIGGSYYFLAVQLGPGVKLVPETVGAALQFTGICWELFAKASLRGSFGILPANRGVVSNGAYRFMRHPMYFGYFITDIGFLVVNFGIQNVMVFAVQFALQAGRIVREERLLSIDAPYRAYKDKVRFRVVPGLF